MATKLKILLDTSVIISALNSSSGASAAILEFARKDRISLITTPYIFNETEKVIEKKFPLLKPLFQQLKGESLFAVAKEPDSETVRKAHKIISDHKDTPILAAGMIHKVNYLVTLDRKDFIDDRQVSKKSKLKILTPAEMIKLLRERLEIKDLGD